MDDAVSRRNALKLLGVTGLAALGAGTAARADEGGATSKQAARKIEASDHPACTLANGKVIQPQRELPVLHQTDVLVVGGGPAGVAAAVAAKRAGAETTLVERYGHFGGLWTGGLVLLVMAMHDRDGKQVTRGIGEEILARLDKMGYGIINRKPGVLPTVDAEATKYAMLEIIQAAQVKVFLHCWGVDAIMENGAVRGAVFESKTGRQAILAKVVVDATGDGDILAAASVPHERRNYHIGLVSRVGGLQGVDFGKLKKEYKFNWGGSPTPVPGVHWVNMHGPDADACSVADLTRLEMSHRKHIWESIEKLRALPGGEKACLIETAPQLGVRIARLVDGMKQLTMQGALENATYPDVIGYGGACYNLKGAWQIPYGALVPKKGDNVLAAGRCIATEFKMIEPMRLISPCYVSGHAAGAAAALAVKNNCQPRDVDVPKLQELLKSQGAYLG
jgi:ribulose 1,5-bisphosphate synthetase/thiazole synthase